MGQYQEWLHHREVERALHNQINTLEDELAQLDQQIELLTQTTSLTDDNSIIQALLRQQRLEQVVARNRSATDNQYEVSPANTPLARPVIEQSPEKKELVPSRATAGSVSPALLAWGSLPNFTQQVPRALPPAPTPAPRPEDELLPRDMTTFVKTYNQNNPQFKLPWWLHSALAPDSENSSTSAIDSPIDSQSGPVDQQSNRTNQLVQRWFQRRQRFAQQIQERREQGTL